MGKFYLIGQPRESSFPFSVTGVPGGGDVLDVLLEGFDVVLLSHAGVLGMLSIFRSDTLTLILRVAPRVVALGTIVITVSFFFDDRSGVTSVVHAFLIVRGASSIATVQRVSRTGSLQAIGRLR